MSFLLGIKNKFMIIISGLVSVVMGIMYFIILKKDNNIKDLEKDNIIKDVEVQVKDNNIESVYSKDFFSDVCISEENSRGVVKSIYNKTKDEGHGFHLITYEKIHPLFLEFANWLKAFMRGENLEEWKKWKFNTTKYIIENKYF